MERNICILQIAYIPWVKCRHFASRCHCKRRITALTIWRENGAQEWQADKDSHDGERWITHANAGMGCVCKRMASQCCDKESQALPTQVPSYRHLGQIYDHYVNIKARPVTWIVFTQRDMATVQTNDFGCRQFSASVVNSMYGSFRQKRRRPKTAGGSLSHIWRLINIRLRMTSNANGSICPYLEGWFRCSPLFIHALINN